MKTVFVVLSAGGAALARRLRPALNDASVHGLSGRVGDVDVAFEDTMAHLRQLHRDGAAIVGVCAAGILIRALGPMLRDKREDPPVVALAEDGSVAVPLLGGHRGANGLARQLAGASGGVAAITTAGDVRFGFSLDDPPSGWRIANPAAIKPVTAALLSGAGARLVVEAGDAGWLANGPWRDDAAACVRVTDTAVNLEDDTLVLHPPVLAVGVGCERGTRPEELHELVTDTLRDAGLASGAVAAVGSLDLKSDEPAVHAAADALDIPARFFDAAALEREAPRLQTPSEIVYRETGCHGVAEGAALALAGPDSQMIVPKRKSARATCAVARATRAVDPNLGRPRGSLAVVGIGPGDPSWRSAEAVRALDSADYIVGYQRYLDLVGDLGERAERRAYGLGEEETRVRDALSLAGEGHRVALVCSGDAGIYALASLVFEIMASEPAARRPAVAVAPGISAMQAAAARVGAPLGHDFCAISLSDLLTPRAAILTRLDTAAAGDFVTALYNPQSRRRRDLLAEAKAIFLARRPPETPVIVARNLGRADESVCVSALAELDLDSVDMLTLLIVGSSGTRALTLPEGVRVYTPRGYGVKA